MDVMLSALQHYAFCPRQCALIHVELAWEENAHTALGRLMHGTAHEGTSRMRDGVKVVTDLELRCVRLGLHGRADVVEFRRAQGGWEPYPVEYKKGRPHAGSDADEVQLCGQALCLEEMLGTEIPEGALFYGEARRRRVVALTHALRARTEEVARAVRALLESGETPPPRPLAWCAACSLNGSCLPGLGARRAGAYIRHLCGEGE